MCIRDSTTTASCTFSDFSPILVTDTNLGKASKELQSHYKTGVSNKSPKQFQKKLFIQITFPTNCRSCPQVIHINDFLVHVKTR